MRFGGEAFLKRTLYSVHQVFLKTFILLLVGFRCRNLSESGCGRSRSHETETDAIVGVYLFVVLQYVKH